MNRSVSNPIPPQDYLASRNYTNGTQSEMGNTMTAEAAGSIADERIPWPRGVAPSPRRVDRFAALRLAKDHFNA